AITCHRVRDGHAPGQQRDLLNGVQTCGTRPAERTHVVAGRRVRDRREHAALSDRNRRGLPSGASRRTNGQFPELDRVRPGDLETCRARGCAGSAHTSRGLKARMSGSPGLVELPLDGPGDPPKSDIDLAHERECDRPADLRHLVTLGFHPDFIQAGHVHEKALRRQVSCLHRLIAHRGRREIDPCRHDLPSDRASPQTTLPGGMTAMARAVLSTRMARTSSASSPSSNSIMANCSTIYDKPGRPEYPVSRDLRAKSCEMRIWSR